jgi:hypothetical protein
MKRRSVWNLLAVTLAGYLFVRHPAGPGMGDDRENRLRIAGEDENAQTSTEYLYVRICHSREDFTRPVSGRMQSASQRMSRTRGSGSLPSWSERAVARAECALEPSRSLKVSLAAALKRSGIQRRFPIAVGTRSRAFPDFGSGCAGLQRSVRVRTRSGKRFSCPHVVVSRPGRGGWAFRQENGDKNIIEPLRVQVRRGCRRRTLGNCSVACCVLGSLLTRPSGTLSSARRRRGMG